MRTPYQFSTILGVLVACSLPAAAEPLICTSMPLQVSCADGATIQVDDAARSDGSKFYTFRSDIGPARGDFSSIVGGRTKNGAAITLTTSGKADEVAQNVVTYTFTVSDNSSWPSRGFSVSATFNGKAVAPVQP